jgi:hypothetical protein
VSVSTVRITPDSDRPRRVQGHRHHGVTGPHVAQQPGQLGPVVAHPGQRVGEDPFAAGGGQYVAVRVQRLVISTDPGVPRHRHAGQGRTSRRGDSDRRADYRTNF